MTFRIKVNFFVSGWLAYAAAISSLQGRLWWALLYTVVASFPWWVGGLDE